MLKRIVGLKRTGILKKTGGLKKTGFLRKTSTLKATSGLKKTTTMRKQNLDNKAKWEEIRQKALSRDNFKCIVCGKPATQVHHIHLRSKRKDLMYNLNNLVSLCSEHHYHKSAYRYNEQTELIARVKNMNVDELLKFAETKGE